MGNIIISENVSLDGVIQDPAGDEGFRHGGWIGRIGDRGREEAAKIALDEALGTEAMRLGSAQLRVLSLAVAIPDWRHGGQAEQQTQVRCVLDPPRSRLEQHDRTPW